MTDDLSILPEPVRYAISALDVRHVRNRNGTIAFDPAWRTVRAELLRLTVERDALRKRIDDAILVEIDGFGCLHAAGIPITMYGKRVRLVLDD